MSELLELAERCEQATGYNYGLNKEILRAVDPDRADGMARRSYYRGLGHAEEAPNYTASIDAAMTLVPEGWHVAHLGEARFMTRSPAYAATVETWGEAVADDGSAIATVPDRRNGVAGTFALALCAAALRARAATPSSNTQEIEP